MEKDHRPQRKSSFVNGVAVGFGIGCFATFIALLIAAFQYSHLAGQSLDSTLSSLLIPLNYFIVLGILFLLVGFLWERSEKKLKL